MVNSRHHANQRRVLHRHDFPINAGGAEREWESDQASRKRDANPIARRGRKHCST